MGEGEGGSVGAVLTLATDSESSERHLELADEVL